MLKKQKKPTSNNSGEVLSIVSGARKRRMLADAAVRSMDGRMGAKSNLFMIK